MVDVKTLTGNVVTSSIHDKVILAYGPPGTWKTTFATGDKERTLLGAYEIGYKFIPGVKAVNLTNWHGLKDLIRQLKDPDVQDLYDTFVIDTIGLAYKACVSYICAKEGVTDIGKIPYGQGYSMAKNEFEKTIHLIPQLGYGLIMIAHSDELNDEKNGVSVKVDIDKRPSSVIKGMADFILYAHKEKLDESDRHDDAEMGVYAYTETKNENIEVKSRARFFPRRILFTYENFVAGLAYAIAKQDEFFGTVSVSEPNFEQYAKTEVDIETVKKEIVVLAEQLFKSALVEKAQNAISRNMRGVKVGAAKQIHAAQLFATRDELIEVQKEL